MASIDDMGQGNESIRILGIRWLPTGNASQTVTTDGKVEKSEKDTKSDRTNPGNSQEQDAAEDNEGEDKENKQEEEDKKTDGRACISLVYKEHGAGRHNAAGQGGVPAEELEPWPEVRG